MVLAAVAIVALAGCSPRHSGVYLINDNRSVVMVQVIEAKDRTLTGRIEEVSLDGDGKASSRSIPITGQVDGSEAVLRSGGLLGGASFTGQFQMGAIILSRDGIAKTYRKANLATFEREVEKLRAQGDDMASAKRVGDANAAIAKANAMLDGWDRATPEILRQVDTIRQHVGQVEDELRRSNQVADALSNAGRYGESGQARAHAGAMMAERGRTQAAFSALRGAVNEKMGETEIIIRTASRSMCAAVTAQRYAEICRQLAGQETRLQGVVEKLRPQFQATERALAG
jgi:hypothetical protein